jgi:hypothetical protein
MTSFVRLAVINHVTPDGVIQALSRPDEDTRGGFSHGGWAVPRNDDMTLHAVGGRMGKPERGLLRGRTELRGPDERAAREGRARVTRPTDDLCRSAPSYL